MSSASGATDSPGSFGLFSANGNRGRSNNYLLDGTDMNDGYRNDPAINEAGVFGTPATILPVDAIEETQIASNFMPEYGRNAGAIFLGRHTPEAVGDYIAGPNHVLPTARSARFASGLGVLDFIKRTSLLRCDAASLAALAPAAIRLAEAEGLEAHALSLSIRLTSEA